MQTTANSPDMDLASLPLRKQLTVASHILFVAGQNDINNGQVSARFGRADRFWVKAPALGFDEVTENSFLELAVDGGTVFRGDGHRPPEWPIHSRVYRSRPDINAIVHTHAFHATVFSATGMPLLPISHDGCPFHKRVNIFSATTNTILDIETGDRVAAALADNFAVILKNHGIVTVGRNIKEATVLALLLERACAVQLAIPSGASIDASPDDDVAQKNQFIFSDAAIATYWDYYRRRLSRASMATQLPEARPF